MRFRAVKPAATLPLTSRGYPRSTNAQDPGPSMEYRAMGNQLELDSALIKQASECN